jgi:hypothetical protein
MLVLVSSVLWLKPSAAQQRQTELRLLARRLGLDVRLCPLPQTRRDRVRGEPAQQGVVYRLLRFGAGNRASFHYLACRADAHSEWESETATALPAAVRAALERALSELPADAVAFEIAAQECGVYWRERGDEEIVKLLRRLLEDVQQACLAS